MTSILPMVAYSGRRYVAVPYDSIGEDGLKIMFPEIDNLDNFGTTERHSMLNYLRYNFSAPISAADLDRARDKASIFDRFFLPITTALLSLQPRSWEAFMRTARWCDRRRSPLFSTRPFS
ncbi:hypothetical protein K458DRAFT_389923 [Lentithecium fluviatile CBS 122367]|uniref:Uncharacterized protein n=1 Tax=Lentithecium fluviatile CBS 122367 TaxID=1168545 RepID=A0A6G1IYH7_9PLEO|nr:hypothetical protein K458DRAFT_389923 [Lentithecium fluviatile CBS 122367]